MTVSDFFGEVIYSYTRANALEDGELVDVSITAREAGFRVPVAVTRAVWDKYIDWEDSDSEKQTCQDLQGRLWDVLWMARVYARLDQSQYTYTLNIVPRDGKSTRARKTELKAMIHGGDEGEPVMTIMLPHED